MCLAVPAKVIAVDDSGDPLTRRGTVDFGGVRREVCLAFVQEAGIGDYVLIHAGFALNVVTEEDMPPALPVDETA